MLVPEAILMSEVVISILPLPLWMDELVCISMPKSLTPLAVIVISAADIASPICPLRANNRPLFVADVLTPLFAPVAVILMLLLDKTFPASEITIP